MGPPEMPGVHQPSTFSRKISTSMFMYAVHLRLAVCRCIAATAACCCCIYKYEPCGCCTVVRVYATAAAAMRRVVYECCCCTNMYEKNECVYFFVFGVTFLHSNHDIFGTPWQYVVPHSWPLFVYAILDRYGHARSRRRVSDCRGEAPLVEGIIVQRLGVR